VVITTAKQLGVPGEVPLVLRGLTYPASDRAGDASNYDAVRLFSRGVRRGEGAERASAQDQRRTGAVCRLLRGIPLAVELAAGWGSRALDRTTLWALRRRIRSCQHQSPWEEERILWVACERTLKMLPRDTRAVFVRLAMFRGGWREPAAVAVALAESDQLRALVDASLLRVTRSRRYEMHEALRAFALERLYRDKRESSRVFRRFCAYFATFVADRCGDSRGSDTSAALREMTEEIDSIRAAWSLAVERHDARTVGAFLPGLAAYYEARGLIHEAVRMFGRAVEAFESTAAANDRDGVDAEVQRLILAREEFSRRLG
jgi:hypothetical protein